MSCLAGDHKAQAASRKLQGPRPMLETRSRFGGGPRGSSWVWRGETTRNGIAPARNKPLKEGKKESPSSRVRYNSLPGYILRSS